MLLLYRCILVDAVVIVVMPYCCIVVYVACILLLLLLLCCCICCYMCMCGIMGARCESRNLPKTTCQVTTFRRRPSSQTRFPCGVVVLFVCLWFKGLGFRLFGCVFLFLCVFVYLLVVCSPRASSEAR